MKKVLILTASTGEGHNQAARSLEEKYLEEGYLTYKLDFLKETSKVMNKLVADGYRVLAQNFPGFYGVLYKAVDRKSFNRLTRAGYMVIKREMYRRIKDISPDVIIATHPFAVGLIDQLKVKNRIDCSFITVVTDFKAHYAYIAPTVDAYITGSEYTKRTLIDRNIPENKIYTYGIPVKKAFQDYTEPKYIIRAEADGRFHVLVMGGSMGSKDIAKVVKRLVMESENYYLDVVCGRNQSLYNSLMKKYSDAVDEHRLMIHGFTKNIPEMMDKADVIVTKPGGLTTTEALSKKLPMVIPFAIPGQEKENADFLAETGVAIYVDDIETLPEKLEYLRKNPRVYNNMVYNMEKISDQYSMGKIIDLSEELIDRHNILQPGILI